MSRETDNEWERWNNQMDEISKREIKLCSELAWEQTMKKNGDCECGAEERIECRCRRTEEYKRRSKAIKEKVLPEAWSADPLRLAAQKVTGEKLEDTENEETDNV